MWFYCQPLYCEACVTDQLASARPAPASYSPTPQGPSLLSWDDFYPGQVWCFLKSTLFAGLGLWLPSLSPSFSDPHFLKSYCAPGYVLETLKSGIMRKTMLGYSGEETAGESD